MRESFVQMRDFNLKIENYLTKERQGLDIVNEGRKCYIVKMQEGEQKNAGK